MSDPKHPPLHGGAAMVTCRYRLPPSCVRIAHFFFPMAVRILRIPMMSYAEKPDDITKEEWMEKLNNVHIQRADMNRLIMNYLVTGEASPAGLMTVIYL